MKTGNNLIFTLFSLLGLDYAIFSNFLSMRNAIGTHSKCNDQREQDRARIENSGVHSLGATMLNRLS